MAKLLFYIVPHDFTSYHITHISPNKKSLYFGNDTIDRYPLPYERRLTKILCVTKEVFKKLKAALAEFRLKPKPASFRPKQPLQEKVSKKRPLAKPRLNDLRAYRNRCISSFEPTNSIYTRYRSGPVWTPRNLKAWFKEQASYEDSRYIENYPVEI